MSNKSGIGDNIISLPKGGGAQSGMGETFSPDLFTGTGNFSVPIAVPAGRNGFQPQLNLSYSTGSGNSSFGMGWGISVPGVMRKTNKGIPLYDDDKDVFILSGAEDLVPIEKTSNTENGITHIQWKYRPRTEGLFARIIHHKYSDGKDYWEVRSKDGLISYYGNPDNSEEDYLLNNPAVADNIFAWKLCKTVDPFGNSIVYTYEKELIDDKEHLATQQYLKGIKYVNYDDSGTEKFLCSLLFTYEDRPDAFSEGRAGFEVRTTKRCTQIETYTHPKDADLPAGYSPNVEGNSLLQKRYELRYRSELPLNGASLLEEIQVFAYDANTDETESMPALKFGYTEFNPNSRDFFPLKGKALPYQSLAAAELELADLDGNGLPDFIEMNGQAVRYWKNQGNGSFALPQMMKEAPAFSLADPEVQLMDADGDGRIDLVVSKPAQNGYFSLNHNGKWDSKGMKRYKNAPSFSFADPEVKLLDLDGDGITDVLRSGGKFENFYQKSYANGTLKAEGWSKANTSLRGQLESFPNVNFSNPRIKLADMNGDGMQDIVHVENGSIFYWPNMGHGKWGKRRTMKGGNGLKFPQQWNPRLVILGDVVGDGQADLIYVDNGEIHLWINQSGNQWSERIRIKGTPAVYEPDAVRLVDLLGSGVAGLLFTYNRGEGGMANQQAYFLDFTSGTKPYVMNQMDNQMGAVTKVTYESSVKSWMRDNVKSRPSIHSELNSEHSGSDFRPWKTTLPFPVQVVAKTEVIDQLSKGKLATEYRYSHGYWDGYEREFRGFGRVEQRDTETFQGYNVQNAGNFEAVSSLHYSPPTKTVNWFHLGGINNADPEDRQLFYEADFSNEYWEGDNNLLERSQTTKDLLKSLAPHDRRDAYRAWRGSKLRTELYAADANGDFSSPLAQKPFTISESSFGIRLENENLFVTLSGVEVRQKAIFFSFSEASRTTNWERGTEPKTSFSFTADYDAYGQARKQISIAVPRGKDPLTGNNLSSTQSGEHHAGGYLCTYAESSFIHKDESNTYICDRLSEQKSFEVDNAGNLSIFALRDAIFNDTATLNVIAHALNYYDGNAFSGLALGSIGDYGVLSRSESLYSTQSDLTAAYTNLPEAFKTSSSPDWSAYPTNYDVEWPNDRAGFQYKNSAPYETGFYRLTQQQQYDFQEIGSSTYGLTTAMKDAFNQEATVDFDTYGFLPLKVTDPIGMETIADYDYRILQANLVTDANENQTAFGFSPLGLLKATAVMGKTGDNDGDTLADPGTRMEYDFHAFANLGQPIWVKTIRREHHINEGINNDTITTIEYSDGFGRLLQSRVQAEDVIYDDSLPADQEAPNANAVGTKKSPSDPDNVVVNGHKVYNNKGKVVEQYEPYFDSDYDYTSSVQIGQKIRLFYDALDRPIQTLNPDGTAQLTVYGKPAASPNFTQATSGRIKIDYTPTPWESYAYDANDLGGQTHPTESSSYSSHWNTPESNEIDALGRTIKTTQRLDSTPANDIVMQYEYDIQGRLTKVTDPLSRDNFIYLYATVVAPKGEENEQTPPEAEALSINHLDSGLKEQLFDARGALIQNIDAKSSRICFSYNAIGQLRKVWMKESGGSDRLSEQFTYGELSDISNNQFGKLKNTLDEAGEEQYLAYDFKGNLLQKQRRVIKDALLTGTSKFQIDWDTGVPNDHLDTQIFETTTDYDALNRIQKVTLPEDTEEEHKEIIPHYNRAGALEKVEMDEEEYVKEIAYNAKGQRLLISFGNGVMNRYTYAPQNFRLLRMKAEKYTFSETATERTYAYNSGTNRQDLAYEYDLNGNILKKKNRTPDCGISGTTLGVDGLDNQYTYDAISRLLSASGRESDANNESHRWTDAPVAGSPNASNTQSYTRNYQYDEVGNVEQLQQTGTNSFTRSFNYTDNTLDDITVSGTPTAFTYDAKGNLVTSGNSRYYEWNEKDQLSFFKIQSGGTPSVYAHYLYDAGGNRVKKIVWDQQGNKEVTVYIDGIFEYRLKHEDSTDKEQNIIHVMDDSARIAQVRIGTEFNDDIAEEVNYVLDDHIGSSTTRLGATGSVIDRQEYYPFGDTSLRTYSFKRYQYVGKEKDAESGLIYYGARYYAAWTCRFISVDPLAADYPHLTPYNNAGNKVINTIDIDGMQGEGETTKPEGGNTGGSDGGGTISAYEIEHGSITIIDPHQAPPPESMQKMQPKGFANDATQVAPPEAREPVTPRQEMLEKSDNLTKQSPNQGSIDYPSNDMRSIEFQAFDRYNATRQTERAMQLGTDIAGIVTGAFKLLTLRLGTILKGIKSLFKKNDDVVDLVRHRKDHILNRHRAGTGKVGKTEFPESWSDDRIIKEVNKIANDPNAISGVGKWDSPYKIGKIDGVEIRVDFYPKSHPKYSGKVSTAYPINKKPN